MIYEFKQVAGDEVIEEFFPVKDAPELGSLIERNGKVYQRIISGSANFNREQVAAVQKYPYVSLSLPDLGDVCEKTPSGYQIVRSQAHERNIMAITGRVRA